MAKPSLFVPRLTIGIIALIVMTALCALLITRIEQTRASRLIASLEEVVPGVTSRKNVQDIISSERFLTHVSNACEVDSGRGCDQFVIFNRVMMYLHMAPARWVWVTLDYQNDVVVSKSVQFAEEPRRSVVTTQMLRDSRSPLSEVQSPGKTVFVNNSDFRNTKIRISDDETVALPQRQKDWRVDLSCLSQIGACSDLRAILPEALPKN